MIAASKLMNKRTICSGSWPPLRIRFQPFPVCHRDGFTAGKHKKRSTLADDVRGLCEAVRKGERRAGVGTGAVEGSLGEDRNNSNNNNSCLFYSDHSCLGISGRFTQYIQ